MLFLSLLRRLPQLLLLLKKRGSWHLCRLHLRQRRWRWLP